VDDIPEYLRNIRGGTESSAEVVEIISERYRAIGGSSPLLDITLGQARALEEFLNRRGGNFRVYVGMRNWSPYIRDAVRQMVDDGVRRVFAMCLAPQYSTWSTELYFKAFRAALKDAADPSSMDVRLITSWANHPLLIDAFVEKIEQATARMREEGHDDVHIIFTVHSIPADSLEVGDLYDEEYDRTLSAIVARVRPRRWYKAYQSQGMIPVLWLGPPVERVLDRIARYGKKTVLVVPVGFVSDHVEVLYDIDIEFKQYAEHKHLDLYRTESMNLSPLFIEALAALVWERMI
jgi:ferrochelatase